MTIGLLSAAGSLLLLGLWFSWYESWKRRKKKRMEEQRKEAVRTKRELEALLATPGWKLLEGILQAQEKTRSNMVLLEPTTDSLQLEYMKGEIQGIRTMLAIPKRMLEESSEIIKATMDADSDESEG